LREGGEEEAFQYFSWGEYGNEGTKGAARPAENRASDGMERGFSKEERMSLGKEREIQNRRGDFVTREVPQTVGAGRQPCKSNLNR